MLTIRFSEDEYMENYDQIKRCLSGSMCKIAEETNILTGAKRYIISTDISKGWSGNQDSSATKFHGWRGTTNDWERNGLGTFYLVDMKEQKNGRYCLRFTDDLNPETP